MNQIEGLPLPSDVIYANVCKHLWLKDLAMAQRVSKSWFFFFLCDHAYAHVKNHIVSELPGLLFVFEHFPWKYKQRIPNLQPSQAKPRTIKTGNKKRQVEPGHVVRKQWIMPSGGTWYVLKRWINYMTTWQGLKHLLSRKRYEEAKLVIVGEWVRSWMLWGIVDPQKRQAIIDMELFVRFDSYGKWEVSFGYELEYVFGYPGHDMTVNVRINGRNKSFCEFGRLYMPFKSVLNGNGLDQDCSYIEDLQRELQKFL